MLQLNELLLPDHWMKYFFTAQVYLELQLNQDALQCYEKLRSTHFPCSTYVVSQLAMAYHNIRGLYLPSLHTIKLHAQYCRITIKLCVLCTLGRWIGGVVVRTLDLRPSHRWFESRS